MQTRDMWKSGKWKLVAGAATLSALGIGGMAMADSDSPGLPDAINLKDQVTTGVTLTPIPDFVVNSRNQVDLTALDSPFDDDATDDDLSATADIAFEPHTRSNTTPADSNVPANPNAASGDDSPDLPTTTPTAQAPPPIDATIDGTASGGTGDDSAGS